MTAETFTLCSNMARHLAGFVLGNSFHSRDVVEEGSAKGRSLVIAGAGPSLNYLIWRPSLLPSEDVWACNSALPWLVKCGVRVTHGFAIDQTADMLDEWASSPSVEYLLASTVHPDLTKQLLAAGRSVRFFHNYVGIPGDPVSVNGQPVSYEHWLYGQFFPRTVIVGSGLNAVTRAIDMAEWMGYERITVLGADCALRTTAPRPLGAGHGSPEFLDWLTQHTVMHANGDHALASGATARVMHVEVDGREWTTKPDLLVSAVHLVHMQRRLGDRLSLVGDTLPNALREKDDAFLDALIAPIHLSV